MVDVNIRTNHIQLNRMKHDNCVGRVLHKEKVQFQEPNSNIFASFNTFSTFSMNNNQSNHSEDGFAFLILPNNSASNFEQLWWSTWPCQCCKQWRCQQSFVCNWDWYISKCRIWRSKFKPCGCCCEWCMFDCNIWLLWNLFSIILHEQRNIWSLDCLHNRWWNTQNYCATTLQWYC